ncbi:MAG: TorF family putative porin [Candidatus Marinimicrobia bacterium]|nr:TorF family putative porin [Candidatus Neomarinimicrobiota bacterium]
MSKQAVGGWLALAVLWAGGAGAAEVEVNVDAASAYVFRGVTLNDGMVLQPSVEVAGFPVPLTVGVWGNFDLDDYDGALTENQFSEVDWYASYAVALTEKAEVAAGYTEYTYPGAEGDADREASLGLALDLPLAPSLTVYYGLDGAVRKDLYIEAAVEHGVEVGEVALTAGATVGYLDPEAAEAESGFANYTVSLGASYGIVSVTGTYIGQIDDEVLTDEDYDVELVGVLSLTYGF